MAIYKTRRGARNYGIAIGILQLDCSLPFIPGDVDNADTYDFPVIYKVVPGLSTKACLGGAPELARAAVETAVELEKQGVRAISSDCPKVCRPYFSRSSLGSFSRSNASRALPLITRSSAFW